MKRFAAIGLGRFGFHAARALYEEGHEVIAMDTDKARVQLVEPYCSEALVLDATDRDKLKALGLEAMDAVLVSIGTSISNSILICLYLRELGVQKIVAKALDEDHAKILTLVGATEVVHPEKDMAIRIARELSTPNVLDFIPLAKDYTLAQIEAPQSFTGKTLQQIDLRAKYKVQVIAIKERQMDCDIRIPTADYVIRPGDVFVLLGTNKSIETLKRLT